MNTTDNSLKTLRDAAKQATIARDAVPQCCPGVWLKLYKTAREAAFKVKMAESKRS